MKVCFFLGTAAGIGGTERACIAIANGLAELGHSVFLVSLWDGSNPFFKVDKHIECFSLFAARISFTKHYVGAVIKLRRLARKLQPDVFVVPPSNKRSIRTPRPQRTASTR